MNGKVFVVVELFHRFNFVDKNEKGVFNTIEKARNFAKSIDSGDDNDDQEVLIKEYRLNIPGHEEIYTI